MPAPNRAVSYELPILPFDPNGLWPTLSPKLIALHWNVLHAKYLDRWKALRRYQKKSEELTFNSNGAILHDLWWFNLCGRGASADSLDGIGPVFAGRIGYPEALQDELIRAGQDLRGSGWVCLSAKPAKKRCWDVKVHTISNHSYDWKSGFKPLVLIDLWEHSYWPEATNRASYLKAIVNDHIDWHEAEARLEIPQSAMLDRSWLLEKEAVRE